MQKVRAWGPGLHGGIVGRSADFVVESIGSEVGSLGKWKRLLVAEIAGCLGHVLGCVLRPSLSLTTLSLWPPDHPRLSLDTPDDLQFPCSACPLPLAPAFIQPLDHEGKGCLWMLCLKLYQENS